MAEPNSATPVVDDDKPVTEEDLRALKYPDEGVETSKEEDEPSDGEETSDDTEETSEVDDKIDTEETAEEVEATTDTPPEFVKKFDYIKGDTPEEYAKNLEAAYENSSVEGRRINAELQALKNAPPTTEVETEEKPSDTPPLRPLDLYAKQKMDEDIQKAYTTFQTEYPQVSEPTNYDLFTKEVATFSRTILDSQGRLASPSELYSKAAISLGWEKKNAPPDDKDKLGMALKDGAATSKPTSASTKPKPNTPKVSEAQLKLNRKMYPGKTDQEIIEELTPYLT